MGTARNPPPPASSRVAAEIKLCGKRRRRSSDQHCQPLDRRAPPAAPTGRTHQPATRPTGTSKDTPQRQSLELHLLLHTLPVPDYVSHTSLLVPPEASTKAGVHDSRQFDAGTRETVGSFPSRLARHERVYVVKTDFRRWRQNTAAMTTPHPASTSTPAYPFHSRTGASALHPSRRPGLSR